MKNTIYPTVERRMAKYKNSNDKVKYEVVAEGPEHFNGLVSGHKKLLAAIAAL
ncbi:MAG: hypothetical protein KAT83_02825 [Candidatus Aenigmarchaeota archaeon]|nr:hypothetical protein [Candidatus Aenigmarchaeota archaeon]